MAFLVCSRSCSLHRCPSSSKQQGSYLTPPLPWLVLHHVVFCFAQAHARGDARRQVYSTQAIQGVHAAMTALTMTSISARIRMGDPPAAVFSFWISSRIPRPDCCAVQSSGKACHGVCIPFVSLLTTIDRAWLFDSHAHMARVRGQFDSTYIWIVLSCRPVVPDPSCRLRLGPEGCHISA